MRHVKFVRALMVTLALAVTAVITGATPAQAKTKDPCYRQVTLPHTARWRFFSGHDIRAAYRECHDAVGTPPELIKVFRPTITLPTMIPAGGGEKVKVSKRPFLYEATPKRWIWRFQVAQSHVLTPKIWQKFDMELRVYRWENGHSAGVGRICYVGHKCGKLSK